MNKKSTAIDLKSLPTYESNPFAPETIQESTIRTKREIFFDGQQATINRETGEISENDIALARRKVVESNQFVKVYTRHVNVLFELGKAAQRVCEYAMYSVSTKAINRDEVTLFYEDYATYFDGKTGKSRNTFTRGLAELAEKNLVARSRINQIWYFNPAIIFNGNRARFITEIRRKSEVKKITQAQGVLPGMGE